MTKTEIIEVTENQMRNWFGYPYYGYVSWDKNKIYILHDLHPEIKKAIIAHEKKHIEIGDQGSFWKNELPAVWASLKEQPLGFTLLVLKTVFSIPRIKLLLIRIIKGF